ncbi:flavin reductase family protein [Thalassospira lucentensis]|jgi:flavin reductase (DIM6/NTAB) family NADH-FMN oxidoreductase RutF|uniref:flavin reductase family protein n=1 Tax=Thalassospira lucentensis TaxID=168935 RepID=UPI003D2662E5|tara:strand:- start:2492 stop:3097 length:606 start_codon:yes stop_codon:yes gene_type:complete
MFYEPGKTAHNLPHDPFKACVAPRPIGWISTVDTNGRPNLAPYSFFNAVHGNPPMVMFSSGGSVDSLKNARDTGEFVAAVAPKSMLREINFCSAPLPPGEDEFEYAGLEKLPATCVKPHLIKGVPIHMECEVFQIVELPSANPEKPCAMVIGTVVGLHIDDAIIRDGMVDITLFEPLARLGYQEYASISETFTVKREDFWK